jgi:NADPH:quinone reductase-like Zn-dependent oxidoreductase
MHSYGGPEVLQCKEAPRPQVQIGELLIRVHATGVNPLDWKVRAGDLKGFIQHKLPLIPGWDVSGIVEEVGPGPAAAGQFKKGDEVFARADPTRDGAYADYIAIHGTALALKPKSLHHVRAAAASVAALTAWRSLFDLGQLQSGQRILIHGGPGGVGHFAVQLAKWKGTYVIATASTKNQELLRKLCADDTIDYTTQKIRRCRPRDRHCPRYNWRRDAGTLVVGAQQRRGFDFVSRTALGTKSQSMRGSWNYVQRSA